MRKFLTILTLLLISSKAHAVLCTDLETHSKLAGIDRQLEKQSSLLTASEELLSDIKQAVEDNLQQTSAILSNNSFNSDLSDIKIRDLTPDPKLQMISQRLKQQYPDQDVPISENDIKISHDKIIKAQQSQIKQAELQQSIIYSSHLLNNSQTRKQEIENLILEADQKNNSKQSVDFGNKVLLEILIELRNNNLLLASLVRNQAKQEYKGLINIRRSNELEYTPSRSLFR